ncbi:MAG: NYN domain-containing protein [Chthoniobacteraceae bacterium]|nr:NYN domain-containing protein [Chthoniobacteraceae bacterium]
MPESTPNTTQKRRCIVYLDGFNFYYGVMMEHPEWKWLNLQSFFEVLRLDEEIVGIKHFTAEIDPQNPASPRRARQKVYFRALASLPKVSQIMGKYQLRTVTCRAKDCLRKLDYKTPEEKKTDVNICVAMIEDALDGKVDNIVLVSGDSDLEPAVAMIRRRFPAIKVSVYIPRLPGDNERNNLVYRGMGVPCRPLPLEEMAKHQLPRCVALPDGRVAERPTEWR